MKTLKTLIIIFGVFIFIAPAILSAETIYRKDGTTVTGKIASKADGVTWYEIATGNDIIEEVSIEDSEVAKILNDDGSVSVYSPTYTAPKVKK